MEDGSTAWWGSKAVIVRAQSKALPARVLVEDMHTEHTHWVLVTALRPRNPAVYDKCDEDAHHFINTRERAGDPIIWQCTRCPAQRDSHGNALD